MEASLKKIKKIEKIKRKPLPEAAIRALKEAQIRRDLEKQNDLSSAKEIGGPKGQDPSRYGDWERKGRAIDF